MSKLLTLDKVPLYGIYDFDGPKIIKLKTDNNSVYVTSWPYDIGYNLIRMSVAAARSTICNYTGNTVAETVEIEDNIIKSFSEIEYRVINND